MCKQKSFEEQQLKMLTILPQKLKGYTKEMFRTDVEYEVFRLGYQRCISDLQLIFAKTK